ncbi:MAG TPA: hypothetical protein VGA70_04115 [Longimicrobiales bacterium]|jgi:hypothetical protein
MARIFGFLVGFVWLGLAFGALRRSLAGWDAGQSDIGFWWAVIASLLTIASVGALVGTWLHTRPREA